MTAVDLIATIVARDDTVAEVRALLERYAEHCLAMDGTERFEVYLERDDARSVVVIERYRDRAAFEVHLADPENEVLNATLGTLTDGGSTLRFLIG